MEQELDDIVNYYVPRLDQGSVYHTVRVLLSLAALHDIAATRADVLLSLHRCGFRKVKQGSRTRWVSPILSHVPEASAT